MIPLRDLRHPGRPVGPLWAVTIGSGPPVVLLHGNSESHRIFDGLVPHLAGAATLIGLDSRGHGRSPRGSGPLTIAAMADDVARVIDELGLERPVVAGFSDGGNIALELALRHPGAAGPLVVVGANLFPAGLTTGTRVPAVAAHAVAAAGARLTPRLAPLAERLHLMARQPQITPSSLAGLTQPVRVVVGERDVVRPEHTALIVRALPRATLDVVPRTGHLVPVRAPEVLAGIVRDVLRAAEVAG